MKTDLEIQKDVTDELNWRPELDNTHLSVNVYRGQVVLNGYVPSFAEKLIAGDIAWRVKGVLDVEMNLEVKLPESDQRPDTVLFNNVTSMIRWHTLVPENRIKVKVAGGWVYLGGEVEQDYQKKAIFNAIKNIKGIRNIVSLLTVKSLPDTGTIEDQIKKTLERRADLDAANIRVEAVGDRIILKGTTHSWNERKAIAHVAWSSPGVAAVDDQITIEYD